MAIVNFTGFELMPTGAIPTTPGFGATACGLPTGVSANVTISTAQAKSGTKSLRCNPSAATAYVAYAAVGSGVGSGASQAWTVTFHLYIASLPSSGSPTVFSCNYSSTTDLNLTLSSAGVLSVAWNSGTATGPTLATGQWYRISLGVDPSGGTKICSCKVDGVAVSSPPTAPSVSAITDFNFGFYSSTTGDIYIDDIVFDNAYNVDAYTAHGIWGGISASDGTHSITTGNVTDQASTNITNSTTDAYTRLDDGLINTGSTTYIQFAVGTTNNTFATKFPAYTPGAVPVAVMGNVAFGSHSGGVSRSHDANWYDGSNSAVLYNNQASSLSRAGGYGFGGVALTNPAGGAWTAADIGNLQIRVNGDTNTLGRTYGMGIEVLYPTGGSTPAPGRPGKGTKTPNSPGGGPKRGNQGGPANALWSRRSSRLWDMIP